MLNKTDPLPFPSAVFWYTLRDNLPGVILWGLGYSALLVLAVLLYPVLQENNILYSLLSGFGILARFSDNYGAEVGALVGLRGYLAFQVLSWGPLIFALYSVPKAMDAVLSEEKRATLDLLLGVPLPRWRLLAERTLALLLSLMGILTIVWLALLVVLRLVPAGDAISPADARYAIWHLMPISTAIFCAALLVSVLVRQMRTALGIVGTFILVSFVLRSFADLTREPTLLRLKQLSIFNAFSGITVLTYGPQPRWDAALFAASAVFFLLALIMFHRRDIQP